MEKLLITCRHGAYDEATYHLNNDGKWQMKALAACLKPVIEDRTMCVLSSAADRAIESAEILRDDFGLNAIERHELLWSESGRRPDYEKVKALVKRMLLTSDIVILVTHLEYTNGFSRYFIDETVGKTLGSFELQKGQARITSTDGATDYVIIPLQPPMIAIATHDDDVAFKPPPPRQQTTTVLDDGDSDFPF